MQNFRRIGFNEYYNTRQQHSFYQANSDSSGIAELRELAKHNPKVKKELEIYEWNSHKVFAADDLDNLKIMVNAGAMTFSSTRWRLQKLSMREVAQVMPTPFSISEDDFTASLYLPDYDDWLYGRLMNPRQNGGKYRLSDANQAPNSPKMYKPAQYLTIMNDLIKEAFHTDNHIDIAKTLFQVKHSLKNLINSPDYKNQNLPNNESIDGIASKLSSYLRDRDGDGQSSTEYVRLVNSLPADKLFKAIRLIATDQAEVYDHNNEDTIPSSSLLHHSVFPEGDLIVLSLLLENNEQHALENNEKKAKDALTYWVKRKVQEAFKKIPTINLASISSMDEAIETLHRHAGKSVENRLRLAYFQKMMKNEVLSNPALTENSIATTILALKNIADQTKGITSLMIALIPEMASIDKLDESLAELILIAMKNPQKNKMMIPIDFFKEGQYPFNLKKLVNSNIKKMNENRASISNPSTLPQTKEENALQTFLIEYNKPYKINKPNEKQSDSTRDPSLQPPSKSRKTTNEIATSGNNHLIHSLYEHIAQLTLNEEWDSLVSLITELHKLETDSLTDENQEAISIAMMQLGLNGHQNSSLVDSNNEEFVVFPQKQRLIGVKNACHLVKLILQKQIKQEAIEKKTVQEVFDRLRPFHAMALENSAYLDPTRHSYTTLIMTNLFKDRSTVMDDDTPETKLEFYLLPECIKRQQHRSEWIETVRAHQEYDCCICLSPHRKDQLLNHKSISATQTEKNRHPGMPICQPCLTQTLDSNPKCPACRETVNQQSFMPYQPNKE